MIDSVRSTMCTLKTNT